MFYYQPTALEEAYGIFLLQTAFQITNIHAAFRIAGRQAVPFFCRSGIDRLVLRNMWTVVDPQVNGYMSEPIQFYTFLRLTALAQTGPLHQMLTMAQTQGVSPEDAMRQCLAQTSAVMFHLAVFEGVNIPSSNDLQTVYQRAKALDNMPQQSYATPDAFSPATQTFSSTDYPQQHQSSSLIHQETSSAPDLAVLPTSLELTSIDDAFSGLIEVEDKPLPGLFTPQKPEQHQSTTTESNVPNVIVDADDDEDDFGDFVDSASNQGSLGADSQGNFPSVTTLSSQQPIPHVSSVFPGQNMAGESSFFQNPDEPKNVMGHATVTAPQIDQISDDIQEVEHMGATSRQASHIPTQINGETFGDFGVSNEDKFISSTGADDFGSFASSNPPIRLSQDTTDGFGNCTPAHAATSGDSNGFGEWGIATSTIGSNAAPSINSGVSISDAFEGLMEISDLPLPPIDPATINVTDTDSAGGKLPSLAIEQQSQRNMEEESEAITTTETRNAQSELEVLPAPSFESATQLSLSGSFATDGASKPLSCEETQGSPFHSGANDDATEKHQSDEDETEFGDFAGIAVTEIRHEENCEPTTYDPASAPADSSPTPPISNGITHGAGEFDGNLNHGGGAGLSGWDALDALSELHDKPLPSLETFSADEDETRKPVGTSLNDAFDNTEEEDFGEFVADSSLREQQVTGGGFNAFQQNEPQCVPDSSFDAFDILERTVSGGLAVDEKLEDSPFTILSMPQPLAGSPYTAAVDDGDFGDFVAGDQTDQEVVRFNTQEAGSIGINPLSSSGGHGVEANDVGGFPLGLEKSEKYVLNGTPNQQRDRQQAEASEWDSVEALSRDSFDRPHGILAPPTENASASSNTRAFGSFDDSIPETGGKDEAHQLEETLAQLQPLSSNTLQKAAFEMDEFGDFSGIASESTGQASFTRQSLTLSVASSFGPSVNVAPAVESFDANSYDVFNSCVGATSDNIEHEAPKVAQTLAQSQQFSGELAQGAIAEVEDFGHFDGFTADELGSSSKTAANSDALVTQVPDTFGDDSFGDFSGFESSQQALPSTLSRVTENIGGKAALEGSDNFNDFASFEKPTPDEELVQSPEYKNLLTLRDFVEKASLGLPEAIRVQSNGGHVEFSDCFAANIGMEVPVSEVRKKRIQRSIQIMILLSSSHSKLASAYWQQALTVVRDEISMASIVLGEAAGFTESAKAAVRPKLETYVAGLGEFVRVCRSIVATVGDLLMLHPSSLLTIDTLSSSWCALNLLKDYLEIENGWKKVEELAENCDLVRKDGKEYELESISAVRLYGAQAAVADSQLCQFTLQPLSLSDPRITKSPVAFHNGTYMACAANFLTHKFSSYAQSDF